MAFCVDVGGSALALFNLNAPVLEAYAQITL